jgi:hypothetical protein
MDGPLLQCGKEQSEENMKRKHRCSILIRELSYNEGNVKLVVYLRFKLASEVYNSHFEMSDLILPYKGQINPYQKMSMNNNPHK